MCGITGFYDYAKSNTINKEQLLRMRDAMAYRGPDGSGIWLAASGETGLGHRRLSIFDLSEQAGQPMCNEDESIRLVFNGEIFNHMQLRAELKRDNHIFKTQNSDTEVIIHAYEKWGIDCVKKLRGMFAFALWDQNKRELWLARDRIGIKPLYYMQLNNCFIFASEVKALQLCPGYRKAISEEAVYHYLTFLTVPAPQTMFKNIFKLEAGTVMKVDAAGCTSTIRYWDPAWYLNAPLEEDESIAYPRMESLLKDAVLSWSSSDVPYSATLSSGTDSSLLVALMREKTPDFSVVTMDYESSSVYSEAGIAGEIAARLGIENIFVYQVKNNEFLETCNTYMQVHTDYPPGAQDIILFYLLSGHLKEQGIKICMLGEGADELGGYPSYLAMNREHNALNFFAGFPQWFKQHIYACSSSSVKQKLEVAMGKAVISRKHIQSFSESEKNMLWAGKRIDSSYTILDNIMKEVRTTTHDEFLRKVSNVEFKLRLPEFMLARVDYPTMANSVEARVPFLDHQLVEYSLALSNRTKMKNKQPKFLFKKLLASHLDQKYVYRPKIGFGKMLSPLLTRILPQWFKEQIIDVASHPVYTMINTGSIKRMYERHLQYEDNGFKIWTLYSLAKWMEVHC